MAQIFIMPGMILSGGDAVRQGMGYMPETPGKALLLTSAQNVEYGQADLVTEALEREGRAYCIYDQINQEPTDTMVEEGVRLYREEQCSYLIALGGGSVMDVMKAVALLASNPGSIADYAGKRKPYARSLLWRQCRLRREPVRRLRSLRSLRIRNEMLRC